MLKKPNPRIKNLYNHKCRLHNCNCLIQNEITEKINYTKKKYIHILDASDINTKIYFDNLPPNLEFLEVFNLNYDLTNLPFGLKKLCIVSYKKFNIKVPFGCEFIERIMNYDSTTEWVNKIGKCMVKNITIQIGGTVIDKQLNVWNDLAKEEKDPNSHTGKVLDERTKLIYELADY